MFKCDFCTQEVEVLTGVYNTPEFTTTVYNLVTGDGASVTFAKGQWGACKECAWHIDHDNWNGLLNRVLDMWGFLGENREKNKMLLGSTWGEVRAAILKGREN